jgi:hypothetical protein
MAAVQCTLWYVGANALFQESGAHR